MIEQQLGFSLESFLRGIVGISTVLGVAYLMSYDRKRVDWNRFHNHGYRPPNTTR